MRCTSLLWILAATAAVSRAFPNVDVRVPPSRPKGEVLGALKRELGKAALEKRDDSWKNSTSFERSWDGAVLLQLGTESSHAGIGVEAGIEIVCTTCFLKGTATAELSVSSDFNITETIDNVAHGLKDTIKNFTSAAEEYVEDLWDESMDVIFDDDDFEFPTFDYDFNINVSTIPEARLHFSFDGLELYMLLDTTLSLGATYTLNLYNSGRTPGGQILGLYITEDLQLGLVFTVDLIFSAHGSVDVSSGFHLLLEDGFGVDIALFGDDASGINFNGGNFEFFPVQVESAGAVFSAVLRVGMHAGLSLQTPDFPTFGNHSIPTAGGGIEVGVFANVAEFTTNITAQPDDPDCQLGVAQSYQFALGAAAGATIDIASKTWGPVATTSIPIWYTELASGCAVKGRAGRASATETRPVEAAASPEKRQDMTTMSTTTTATYTGVNCLSTGLINCPASLQNTSLSTATSALTTVVPLGTDEDDISWGSPTRETVTAVAIFGKDAMSLPATAGSPRSYIPPPPTATNAAIGKLPDDIDEVVRGVPERVVIGVSVGLGAPALIAIIALIGFSLRKRRNYKVVPKTEMH